MPMQEIRAGRGPGMAPSGEAGAAGISELVRRVILHIERNYMHRVTLGDLEATTSHNAFQIIRAFRRDLGTTPHAFLMRVRVDQGTRLLLQGASIVGAAMEAGFVDQSHFTRHFRRVHVTTPADFLRRRKAQAR